MNLVPEEIGGWVNWGGSGMYRGGGTKVESHRGRTHDLMCNTQKLLVL